MKKALSGSERTPYLGATPVGAADPNERLDVTVVVRRRAPDDFKRQLSATVAAPTKHIRREDFAQRFGADPKDFAVVEAFANQYGLEVIQKDLARRTIRLAGTVAQLSSAFDVSLQTFQYKGGSYRGRVGSVYLPEELENIVEAVLGLDNRPQAQPHFRARASGGTAGAAAASGTFAPNQLASIYGFPAVSNGAGACIGIVELGGGFRTTDIQQYFSALNLPVPTVVAVSVDGASNAPGDPNGPDAEVMLDIEVAGAIAPGAKLAVYFAPNTDAGFLDAITTAVHDSTNNPGVISISWGGPESTWTQQAMTALDSALQGAATMAITITVASGDNGSSDGVDDGANHVDFPASSSYALACGGTKLVASGGSISTETVWNETTTNEGATGGGVSNVFPLQAWQENLQVTSAQGQQSPLQGRGVPDVSGDADPETGYNVRVDGNDTVIGGTSAVAPLWAALITLINAASGSLAGFINPKLYGSAAACRDVTVGNNGAFGASPGWDACTGLGSPDGQKIADLLGGSTPPV